MRIRRTRTAAAAGLTALLLAAAGCGGGSFESGGGGGGGGGGGAEGPTGEGNKNVSLQMLIASSGDAETNSVKAATAKWAQQTGNKVEVIPAQDIAQQLGQAFTGANPPDVFYADAGRFADYAKAGALYPYAQNLEDKDDFYEPLVQTFTYEDKFVCAPKDFSTLALQINQAAWQKAGLTDADIPKDWDGLKSAAQKLTSGNQAGLVIGDTRDRLGAFMVGAGGWFVNEDATQATADSPENKEAIAFVQELVKSGSTKFPKQVDAGWGGEAFGTQKAAMTVEGNWIKGAMSKDYPNVKYTVVEMPEGPKGKGTLLFTQCWGIAQKSKNQAAAIDLVKFLTAKEQQLQAAKDFGVMPSRKSAEADYVKLYPEDAPFIAGGEYGQGPVTVPGISNVLADFDAKLAGLANANVDQILSELQTNTQAAIGG